MDRLTEFREMIDSIDDEQLLSAGQSLLRDMISVHTMKERVAEMEASYTDGQRAIFYFFADSLDSDEVVFAAERISGRIRRLESTHCEKPAKLKNDKG